MTKLTSRMIASTIVCLLIFAGQATFACLEEGCSSNTSIHIQNDSIEPINVETSNSTSTYTTTISAGKSDSICARYNNITVTVASTGQLLLHSQVDALQTKMVFGKHAIDLFVMQETKSGTIKLYKNEEPRPLSATKYFTSAKVRHQLRMSENFDKDSARSTNLKRELRLSSGVNKRSTKKALREIQMTQNWRAAVLFDAMKA